jgi:hypothetical protein
MKAHLRIKIGIAIQGEHDEQASGDASKKVCIGRALLRRVESIAASNTRSGNCEYFNKAKCTAVTNEPSGGKKIEDKRLSCRRQLPLPTMRAAALVSVS